MARNPLKLYGMCALYLYPIFYTPLFLGVVACIVECNSEGMGAEGGSIKFRTGWLCLDAQALAL